MKREIKFRAWDPKRKQMRTDFLLSSDGTVVRKFIAGTTVGVDPEDAVLMQFTGLKDKNDVEVYEGDIIQAVLPRPTPVVLSGQVKFVERGFWIEIQGSLYWPNAFRVVGNIYENPELIQKEKVTELEA